MTEDKEKNLHAHSINFKPPRNSLSLLNKSIRIYCFVSNFLSAVQIN